ncbi:MAG: Fic family protein [Atopobiaceae bacterium]|nr:Fic family protein [Atopobiaceae bacterium]MCH4180325.1 Fic family protein [Atopobiaceae bacterium]MCH4214865.1 Fic family protein [Atopobiaceae bacterium]MCH4229302.1 Fic family protein [Atopobiaceae bacterium]MCH4276357.1 Fic family protein [Atopobiaceae bacterium]
MDSSPERFSTSRERAKQRLEADSTFRTGIMTPSGELFLAVPRELSLLNEKVLRLERKVSGTMRSLPPVARGALVRGLVMDEVVCTNDLEGIHSTRKQIHDLLDAELPDDPLRAKRFRELAKMYLELSNQDKTFPLTPMDIRAIYDKLMQGEPLSDASKPDGKVFRRGEVEIIGSGSKVLHQGLYPESRIIEVMGLMLDLANSDEVPNTYSAIMAHYVFEYAHPFYDGNGRTGRYLLALFLTRPLSVVTALSVSRVIAENRDAYYKSFRLVEDPLDHGELTFFVMNILEDVRMAQSEIVEDLEEKVNRLDDVLERLEALSEGEGLAKSEKDAIFMLVQLDLFATFPEASTSEVASHLGLGTQQTRKHLKALEGRGLIRTISKRPLRFILTDTAREHFGLGETHQDG